MATQPSLRIGDRERDGVVAELQEHFARGRLTLEEFNQRLDAVFAAKTQGDLNRIISDLPHVRPAGAPLPGARTRSGPMLSSGPAAALAGTGAVAAGWSGPVRSGPGWSGQDDRGTGSRRGRRPGGAYGVLLTLLAALASWFVVMDYLMLGVRFPIPGKIGIFLAVFGLLRGLFRRVFHRR